MAKYKCEVCGKPSLEQYCWKHKPKKALQSQLKSQNKEERTAMFSLFFEIWDNQELFDTATDLEVPDHYRGLRYVRCYETGKRLKREHFRLLTTCYHHVLEKKSYPQYKLSRENIVILHPDVHLQVHQDIDKTPKVKALREKLLQKHLNEEEIK